MGDGSKAGGDGGANQGRHPSCDVRKARNEIVVGAFQRIVIPVGNHRGIVAMVCEVVAVDLGCEACKLCFRLPAITME